MSGDQKLSTQLLLKDFIDKLDLYVAGLGLGSITYSSEVEKALNFKADELRGLNSEECGVYAYKLQQFALFIQKEKNRSKNISNWIDNNIKILIAKEGKSYGDNFTKYDMIRSSIITFDTYGEALGKLYDEFNSKSEELDQISNKIAAISKTLSDLQYTKRFNRD